MILIQTPTPSYIEPPRWPGTPAQRSAWRRVAVFLLGGVGVALARGGRLQKLRPELGHERLHGHEARTHDGDVDLDDVPVGHADRVPRRVCGVGEDVFEVHGADQGDGTCADEGVSMFFFLWWWERRYSQEPKAEEDQEEKLLPERHGHGPHDGNWDDKDDEVGGDMHADEGPGQG